jgi:hypothetical protein
MQIHNNAYSVVAICSEKNWFQHKGISCILHNSREPTKMDLYLSVLFYIKL